jgi:hypothetical protein
VVGFWLPARRPVAVSNQPPWPGISLQNKMAVGVTQLFDNQDKNVIYRYVYSLMMR